MQAARNREADGVLLFLTCCSQSEFQQVAMLPAKAVQASTGAPTSLSSCTCPALGQFVSERKATVNVNQSTANEGDTPEFRPGLLAEVWAVLDRLGASPEFRAYLKEALEAPSRRVRSTPKSMAGRFCSRKMGVTVGYESATLELPALLALENDPEVLLILEQPPKLKLLHRRHGRNRGCLYTPDFLVIRRDGFRLIECKRLEVVETRASNDPEYFLNREGRWVCPPAERAAAGLGITHELWTESDFNPIVLSNTMFLGRYQGTDLDIPGYSNALNQIREALDCLARDSIQSILDKWPNTVTLDHIYLAIGRGDVEIDLRGWVHPPEELRVRTPWDVDPPAVLR